MSRPTDDAVFVLRTYIAAFVLVVLGVLTPTVLFAQVEVNTEPVLILEPGAHTGPIRQIAVNQAQSLLVTVSDDKSARVWDLATNKLVATLRPPAGSDQIGRLYGAAISADGVVAIGGTTAVTGASHRIYLYDLSNFVVLRAIDARGGDIKRLAWSPDGQLLVAAFAESPALRIFKRDGSIVHEEKMPADVWSLAFSADGMLAVPVSNRTIRLYTLIGGKVTFGGEIRTGIADPRGVDFSPDGSLLAVGYNSRLNRETIQVDVVEVKSRTTIKSLAVTSLDVGNLRNVTWSNDGARIYAGGSASKSGNRFVVKQINWPSLESSEFVASTNSVTDLIALRDGRLVVATAEPSWAVLSGTTLTRMSTNTVSLGDARSLHVNATGTAVAFRYRQREQFATFDLAKRQVMEMDVESIGATVRPSIRITDWENNLRPKIDGKVIPLDASEVSRAAVVLPDASGAVLGTSRALRRIDHRGEQVWSVRLSTEARAIAVSNDGRILVVGMADGTIRWRRVADGAMLMSLFSTSDLRWVLWTEKGYYDVSLGAEDLIGWLISRAEGDQADFFAISRFR
ncbi:MAG: hypothetical protein WCL29_05570, partial [Pseudomonadota bacterium]